MLRKTFVIVFGAVVIAGCQPPANIRTLQDKNQALQGQLNDANQQIDQLKGQERLLNKNIADLHHMVGVLSTEKSSRVHESSVLRGQVRVFMQQQIDAIKDFLVKGDLLDYVGGELVKRTKVAGKSLFLVDLANTVPRNGALTGVGAYFAKPTPFKVKVLREVDKQLVVIWESKLIRVKEAGVNRVNFPVSVGVERGDVLAYYFPGDVGVTFDDGTGDTRYLHEDVHLGGMVDKPSLDGTDKHRAYSIGVYALLN